MPRHGGVWRGWPGSGEAGHGPLIEPGRQSVERAVRALVALGSGIPSECVVPGYRNEPFPGSPAATVTPITSMQESFAWSRDTRIAHRQYADPEFTDGPTVDSQAFLPMELSWSVQWFGDAADDFARRFAVWASSPAGASEIARRGLTFYRTSAIRHLDGEIHGRWEERRGLDLVLGAVFTDTRDVGIVESADILLHPDMAGEFPHREFPGRTPASSPARVLVSGLQQEGGDG